MDKLEEYLPNADYVVGILPKTDTTYHFFNKDFFTKMKKSAVFFNVGRGPCHKEDDLIQALKEKTIHGACLDVFEVEPLPKESELWGLPNVLMTPHCADIDHAYLDRALVIFGSNLKKFKSGESLDNICNKEAGY